MQENDKNKQEKKHTPKNKKESGLVTKESFCATFALFALLALLILCTRSLIFGDLGVAVHRLLTGLFGYCVYPFTVGLLYLSITGLFGKRLVKNRLLGCCVAAVFIGVALIVHTALTFRWDMQGYLTRCFESGKEFSTVTPFGWLGGVIVYGAANIATMLGALIFFVLFTAFCIYLCILAGMRKGKVKDIPQVIPAQSVQSFEIPLSQPTAQPSQPYEYGQAAAPQNNPPLQNPQTSGWVTPTVNQRPGVMISENTSNETGESLSGGFSPFNAQRTLQEVKNTYTQEESRDILFGATPAENYRRNLLFDPNSNANRRPSFEPTANGYVPSYSNSYANSLNENAERIRPVKIVSDNAPIPRYEEPQSDAYRIVEPVTPMQPIEETPVIPQVAPITERVEFIREEPTPFEDRTERDNGYKRHDYMNLFSTENPNVFGRNDGLETSEYPTPETQRESFADREATRDFNERDGLRLLDDEEEDSPYEIRSDFSERERAESVLDFSERREDRELPSISREDRGYLDIEPVRRDSFESVARTPQVEIPLEESKPAPVKPRVIRPYIRPRLDDMDCRDIEPTANQTEVEETKLNIISTLEDFKVTGASIASVTFGPTVTRYNVTIPRNISPKKVVALDQSIAISLHSNGVNVYPNYEDGVVSIEVPNKQRQFVQLGCMLSGDSFVNAKPTSLTFAMGKDIANRKIYGDICKMTHLLVAGASNSGKSVFLGALILSLIYKYSPEELRLILIDPKKTEFVLYNNLPHLMINEIITDVNKTIQSLNWAIMEMNRRYGLFEQMSRSGTYVVNLDEYNAQLEKNQRLPKIVIIIDEMADLMLAAKKEMEDRIQNLTQKARAAGIHIIVATQRPSADVITGVIKSNLSTRIAFSVASDVDSRVILDQTGAQKLLGMGDFLYTMPGINVPVRVQSAFSSAQEAQRVVDFIKSNNEAYYDEDATAFINSRGGYAGDDSSSSADKEGVDPMYIDALRYVILSGSASISMIQRKCSAGYNRAGKIIEWMEDMGYISPFDGAKARKVLITKEEFESKYGAL